MAGMVEEMRTGYGSSYILHGAEASARKPAANIPGPAGRQKPIFIRSRPVASPRAAAPTDTAPVPAPAPPSRDSLRPRLCPQLHHYPSSPSPMPQPTKAQQSPHAARTLSPSPAARRSIGSPAASTSPPAPIVKPANQDGFTPLYVAAARSHEPVVRLLLAAGARPDTPDRAGRTPLWAALHPGGSAKAEASPERRAGVVAALLRSGADVYLLADTRDRDYCWQLLAASIAAGE
ncbi:Potassium channel AKT1 [Tetrabaena socialis]|uniref:Potassium channel AKT1 n=1 Tax=Tetrabaena socialis TaxID=47790 RepID=A0A2J8A6F6_9CHLO|nr:Potassium channel AKT1 [Tetrabaena socialis]|eukprot:PNH08085.1 Potassium channel AKT1 [Tetrabaena socialis]